MSNSQKLPSPVVKFERVSVYFGDTAALSEISFSVPPGENRIILGAAGSGKTVLLKTILGLVRPTAGKVWVLGVNITEKDEEELYDIRSRIGMVFQEGGLFDSLTVFENVAYPLLNQKEQRYSFEEIERRVREALRFVELEHTLEKFPSELSGGMRRRVGIARAIVMEPDILLYDSPTAGLDPITAYTIISLIAKERDIRSTTTFVVTHRYQDAHLLANFRYEPESNRLVPVTSNDGYQPTPVTFMVLKEGRLVFEGTEQDLKAASDPYVSKFVRH